MTKKSHTFSKTLLSEMNQQYSEYDGSELRDRFTIINDKSPAPYFDQY